MYIEFYENDPLTVRVLPHEYGVCFGGRNAYYSKTAKWKSVNGYGTNPQNIIHNDKTLIIESG